MQGSPAHAEWLNSNAYRRYPLREDVSRNPVDGDGNVLADITLPDFIVVDFVLTLAATSAVRVYLSQVAHAGDLLTLGFTDGDGVSIGLVSLSISAHTRNTGYTFVGTGDLYEDAIGRIVIGDLTYLKTRLPEGFYNFSLETAEFETRTIRPAIRGVRSLQISNQDSESDYIHGHIKLVAGTNVQLTYDATTNSIKIDAISGANLNEECPCDSVAAQRNVVRTINGIPIEDVIIAGDGQCVTVTTDGDKILIEDKCSEPCCDCPELKLLTESLKVLDATVTNLQDYAQQLDEKIRDFVTNYILSIVP